MKPRLSLCMIVRNEAALLPHCLESVTGVVDEVVVVDTGSTDGTQAIAGRRGAHVIEHPWSGDFAAARNAGLDQARGEWVLVMDGDEALHPEDRAKVRSLLIFSGVEGYLNTQINYVGERPGAGVEYGFAQRIFRNRPEYRYRGRIHERLDLPDDQVRVAPVRILHYGYLKPLIGDRQKRERNLAMLEQAAVEQPDDPMVHYYLGNEYRAWRREADAVAAYRRAKPAALAGRYLYAAKLIKSLAQALLRLDQPGEALSEVSEGLVHFPEFTDLVYLQGLAYRALGRLPEAIGCFHQCLAMGPAASPPYHGVDPALGGWMAAHAVASLHEARGEWERAIRFYRQAWRDGQSPDPLGRLARALVIHRGPAAAEAELAAMLQPADGEAHLLMAEALVAGHHWRGAMRQLELAEQATQTAQTVQTAQTAQTAEAPEAGGAIRHPPALFTAAADRRAERVGRARAICHYHLADFAGANALLGGLPADLYPAERLVAGLASGSRRPGELLAHEGAQGVRLAVAGLLQAAVSSLEQGLCWRPDSVPLQRSLVRAIEEAGSVG